MNCDDANHLVSINFNVQRLYCYVDESGQDTEGKLFLVAVVVTERHSRVSEPASGLFVGDTVWPVGPRIEEWGEHVKTRDLQRINVYEYIQHLQ